MQKTKKKREYRVFGQVWTFDRVGGRNDTGQCDEPVQGALTQLLHVCNGEYAFAPQHRVQIPLNSCFVSNFFFFSLNFSKVLPAPAPTWPHLC